MHFNLLLWHSFAFLFITESQFSHYLLWTLFFHKLFSFFSSWLLNWGRSFISFIEQHINIIFYPFINFSFKDLDISLEFNMSKFWKQSSSITVLYEIFFVNFWMLLIIKHNIAILRMGMLKLTPFQWIKFKSWISILANLTFDFLSFIKNLIHSFERLKFVEILLDRNKFWNLKALSIWACLKIYWFC